MNLKNLHESSKLWPVLGCVGSEAIRWQLLVLSDVEPIQDGCFNYRSGSGATKMRDYVARLGRATVARNTRQSSFDGGMINLDPRLGQYTNRQNATGFVHERLIRHNDRVSLDYLVCGSALKGVDVSKAVMADNQTAAEPA
ncbi:hypothetical protein [Bradyrhizobium sp. USDA 4451]